MSPVGSRRSADTWSSHVLASGVSRGRFLRKGGEFRSIQRVVYIRRANQLIPRRSRTSRTRWLTGLPGRLGAGQHVARTTGPHRSGRALVWGKMTTGALHRERSVAVAHRDIWSVSNACRHGLLPPIERSPEP